MSTDNYTQSVRKYEIAIQDIKKGLKYIHNHYYHIDDWYDYVHMVLIDRCGFCEEFQSDFPPKSRACEECPLFPKYCRLNYEYDMPTKSPVFWRMIIEVKRKRPRRKELLRLAKMMLEEIKRHKKLF